MIIEDFVMLGQTVPETNSDGREFVCTAGYSLELREPVRIYPMARGSCPHRWSMSRIPLERNTKDSRNESWKIRGDRSCEQHRHVNSVIETVQRKIDPETQRNIVSAMQARSLTQANEERRSLCVLFPSEVPTLCFKEGEQAEMAPTPDLFGSARELPVMQRFKWHPRLRFVDEDGNRHDLMLREWGCYELMRKKGNDYSIYHLEQALNLSTAPPLLCGNFNRHRNAWLVISVFSGTVHARPDVMEYQHSLDLPPIVPATHDN
jgi:hypothetical protein